MFNQQQQDKSPPRRKGIRFALRCCHAMAPLTLWYSFAVSVGSWPSSRINHSQAIGQPVLFWKCRPGAFYLPPPITLSRCWEGGRVSQAVRSPEGLTHCPPWLTTGSPYPVFVPKPLSREKSGIRSTARPRGPILAPTACRDSPGWQHLVNMACQH